MVFGGGCEEGYAQEVAHHYHQLELQFEEDAPGGDLLKPAVSCPYTE